MDRVAFLKSVNGIQYPDILVNFFDHFIALKQIVEESGKITVEESTRNYISVLIKFRNKLNRDKALAVIPPDMIMIYERPIKVSVDILAGNTIKLYLQ